MHHVHSTARAHAKGRIFSVNFSKPQAGRLVALLVSVLPLANHPSGLT